MPETELDTGEPTFPLDVALCLDCEHVQLLHAVDPDRIFRDYFFETSSSPGLVDHFEDLSNDLIDRFDLAAGDFVLEVGSNDGSFLQFFQEEGCEVLGVDPAEEIAREANAAGIETLPEYFTSDLAEQIAEDRGRADLVAANNVYAHVPDMHDLTEGIKRCLAPRGAFVFEVSWIVDLIRNKLFDTIYHEHLSYHAIGPLEEFLQSHGLELFDVQHIDSKGGSIRGFVQHEGGPYSRNSRVDEFRQIENDVEVGKPGTYRALANHLHSTKKRLHDFLSQVRDDGGTIAGYGISATVNTLVHHFELEGFIDFYVDDNPDKQGLYSPGHHIPVHGSKALFNEGADVAVVTAWNYADPIIENNQEFIERGGRFVVPLPEFEVRGEE